MSRRDHGKRLEKLEESYAPPPASVMVLFPGQVVSPFYTGGVIRVQIVDSRKEKP